MGKNHGNNNKNVQEIEKEVIEAKVVTPEETEAEDTAKETEDNNADDTPPEKDDKEPKKESLIKRAATKVKGGVKKVLGKQFTIGQVLGLVAGVGAAVFIGKTIYERGQQDALETVGGDIDDEDRLLEVHDNDVSDYDEGGEDVYDVEESEAEDAPVSEDGDNEEVYDEEDEVYDEDMTE